jgi:hypothetical protein
LKERAFTGLVKYYKRDAADDDEEEEKQQLFSKTYVQYC